MKTRFLVLLVALLLITAHRAVPCSTFQWDIGGDPVVGNNYDWYNFADHGFAYINKRNIEKTAAPSPGADKKAEPAAWTSQFMSMTLNQFGMEFPMGGMNEKGLVIEIHELGETEHPGPKDTRPYVNEAQWIQYFLDQYETTQEVIDHVDDIRVEMVFEPAHYLVCDATSECAVIEFLKGKTVVTAGKDLPIKAITNDTYESSLKYHNKNKGKVLKGSGSFQRFHRIAEKMDSGSASGLDDIFDLLVAAGQKGLVKSVWHVAYEQSSLITSFVKGKSDRTSIDLDDFDPSCLDPAKIIDLDLSNTNGGVPVDYTYDLNRELVMENKVLSIYVPALTEEKLEEVALYPDVMTSCTE